MDSTLAPGIVVLNKKYFPRDSLSAAQVGATSFTLSVLQVLYDARILCGVVLYQRDETLNEAHCEMEPPLYDEIPVARVSYNFRMSQISIAVALSEAYIQTTHQSQRSQSPIIYYQTDTLLHYHPPGYRFCVTHHGPFVSDFRKAFSQSLTQLAFGGELNKVEILGQQQSLGIKRLLRDDLGTVLAHSGLQKRVLEGEGLPSRRFQQLRPPIGIQQSEDTDVLDRSLERFISEAEILLFTAVARLDYFKNVELLVQGGIELLNRGVPVKVLVVGDPENDSSRRRKLLETVPTELRQNFHILPRLPKDHLYALFAATRSNGVFFCPSRYETLGITPLEAAASGVATLITDSDKVEATSYMPVDCLIEPDAKKVAAKVQVIFCEGVSKWAAMVKEHVRPNTSMDAFRDDLLGAWEHLSHSTTNMPKFLVGNLRYKAPKRSQTDPATTQRHRSVWKLNAMPSLSYSKTGLNHGFLSVNA